jgi:phospholipid transport system substrate-binding protein
MSARPYDAHAVGCQGSGEDTPRMGGRMLNRRESISLIAALPAVFLLPAALSLRAWASSAGERAAALIKATGDKLVAAINATGPIDQRRQELASIIDTDVDVNSVARFCLGRFWRTTTPAQQEQYVKMFRDMLVANISAKLGEYRGVTFTVGTTQARDSGEIVSTVVTRPNNPPTNIQWVVANAATDPKIIDMIAEGTSLRITQRDDYASFLSQHGERIDALLNQMRRQLSQNG